MLKAGVYQNNNCEKNLDKAIRNIIDFEKETGKKIYEMPVVFKYKISEITNLNGSQ